MAEGRGSGGVSSRPGQKGKGARSGEQTDQIKDHIKAVYDGFASEELPDQLKDLIARLDQIEDEGKA